MILEINSIAENIRLAELFIENIRDQKNIKEDQYGKLMIAVTEAVNNSIIHGNKLNKEKKVIVRCVEINPFRICVIVEDEGDGFSFDSLPDPTQKDRLEEPGGRGVFLMKALADDVVFNNNGKVVELYFNI